eukprot:4311120-Prymnesium_polylepis.3
MRSRVSFPAASVTVSRLPSPHVSLTCAAPQVPTQPSAQSLNVAVASLNWHVDAAQIGHQHVPCAPRVPSPV